jgi:lysozyme
MSSKKKRRQEKKLKLIILISTLILSGIVLGFYFYKQQKNTNTFDKSNQYPVKGIDVSHHNPILDWAEVKNQNINFAYIKATEGISHDDRNYPYNYKLAKENNIKIGAYHFYNFGISGREQAKHFIQIVQYQSGDLLPAIDVEHSPANPYSTDTLFVQNTIKELQIMEKELYEYYGFHPIIYTNSDCYKLYIKGNFPDNLLWISSLNKEPSKDISNWIIWQFTHNGELPGVVGNIDFNYFRYSIDRLAEISLP